MERGSFLHIWVESVSFAAVADNELAATDHRRPSVDAMNQHRNLSCGAGEGLGRTIGTENLQTLGGDVSVARISARIGESADDPSFLPGQVKGIAEIEDGIRIQA